MIIYNFRFVCFFKCWHVTVKSKLWGDFYLGAFNLTKYLILVRCTYVYLSMRATHFKGWHIMHTNVKQILYKSNEETYFHLVWRYTKYSYIIHPTSYIDALLLSKKIVIRFACVCFFFFINWIIQFYIWHSHIVLFLHFYQFQWPYNWRNNWISDSSFSSLDRMHLSDWRTLFFSFL